MMSLLKEMNEIVKNLGIEHIEKNEFFYYNFNSESTAFIVRGTKGHTTLDYLSNQGVRACNALLGNSEEDVEAAVACSFNGDWASFEKHPVRQLYREDTKYPTIQLPLPLQEGH